MEYSGTMERIMELNSELIKAKIEIAQQNREYIALCNNFSATMDAYKIHIDQYKELEQVCILQDKKIQLLEKRLEQLAQTNTIILQATDPVNRLN